MSQKMEELNSYKFTPLSLPYPIRRTTVSSASLPGSDLAQTQGKTDFLDALSLSAEEEKVVVEKEVEEDEEMKKEVKKWREKRKSRKFDCPDDHGYFPDPEDCSAYYR